MPYINKINVGGVLYDVQDLEASTAVPQIKQMISNVESTPATAAHAAGSYLIYNNTLYRSSAAIAVGDALTVGTNIAAVSGGLAGDVADLKSAIKNNYVELSNVATWELGAYLASNGTAIDNDKRIRTPVPINVFNGIVEASGNVVFLVFYYTGFSTSTYISSSGAFSKFVDLNEAPQNAKFFRISARTEPETNLTDYIDTTASNIKLYTPIAELNQNEQRRNVLDYTSFELGTILSYNGTNSSSTTRCRTQGYVKLHMGDHLSVASGYKFGVYEYHQSNGSYTFDGTPKALNIEEYTVSASGEYRIVIAKSDDSTVQTSDIETLVSALYISTYAERPYDVFSEICMFNALNKMALGGLSPVDGSDTSNRYRMRTPDFWLLVPTRIVWKASEGIQYNIYYYDRAFNLLENTGWLSDNIFISANTVPGAMYYKVAIGKSNDRAFTEDYVVPATCAVMSSYPLPADGYIRDIPKNDGVLNAICRALQCVNIKYTTTAVLPAQKGDYAADTTIQGIIYSSTRNEKLWVPNCVSFDSFMTALKSPNSYIYTRQVDNPNGKTYMGCVCSSFVCYCYDLPCVYTTHQIGELENMILLDHQTPYALELGDCLLLEDTHIVLVTDIIRDIRGRMKQIGLTEAAPPHMITNYRTPAWVQNYMDTKHFKIYRYADIINVTYTPTQWVAVENEKQVTPVFNHNLCPRRGDRSNWPEGETVEIDVLNAESYTHAKLYKNDTLVSTDSIGAVLTYSNLEYGSYKVCLTDGTNDSDFVYFIVVNNTVTVTDRGNGTARVSFSSANATPVWLDWCESNSSDSDYKASYHAEAIADSDRTAGYRDTTYEAGTYLFDVEFRTEYGVMSSTLVSATIT